MIEFTMSLSGVTIGVSAMHESVLRHCCQYLVEEEAVIKVKSSFEDIAYEREKSAREDRLQGIPIRKHAEEDLESAALQRKIVEAFYAYDILLFHGSVIAVDDQAYLFTAKSGTGKSTHTRLWREMLGERAVMVNDDKPFLQIKEDKVLVWGSPWNGKHKLGTNICVPLKAICVLERGEENVIRPISAVEALPMLMQQSQRPQKPENFPKYMELIDQLAGKTAFYRMACNMDPQAAEVAYRAMSREGKEENYED